MKKAMMFFILAALLSGCANNAKEENPVTSSAATTTVTTTTAATSSTAVTTTKAVQTTPSVTTQNRYTTTAEASKAAVSAVSASPEITTANSATTQNRQTYVVYETEYAELEQPEQTTQTDQIMITTTTTAATTTTAPSVTAPATASATHPTVEWSENMAVWCKLCEGRQLTGSEQNVIRWEIQDYALTTFNGRQDIHVSFGTDEFDISFEQPLELVVRKEMVCMENAHMDAYCDPNRKGMIDYASTDEEIYAIVSETRSQCLHIIDYGLFNRYEIFTINNALKYASHVEFNIGFDEDMTLWFLTQD